MNALAAGPDGVLQPGKTYDLPQDFAYTLIEGRYADQEVSNDQVKAKPSAKRRRKPKVETATSGPEETADINPETEPLEGDPNEEPGQEKTGFSGRDRA